MSESGQTSHPDHSDLRARRRGQTDAPAVPLSSKLTVIFYIALCLEAGVILMLLPWIRPFGLGDWGDNFFLIQIARATGSQGLQHAVASGWVRGAVSGVGALNLLIAFWEIFNFKRTVRSLQPQTGARPLPQTALPQLAARDQSRMMETTNAATHDDRSRDADNAL